MSKRLKCKPLPKQIDGIAELYFSKPFFHPKLQRQNFEYPEDNTNNDVTEKEVWLEIYKTTIQLEKTNAEAGREANSAVRQFKFAFNEDT